MTRFALITLAAITMVQSAWAAAADRPADSKAKPSSLVPHAHAGHHVYGAPMQPAMGHAKTSHHKQARRKQSSIRTNRDGS